MSSDTEPNPYTQMDADLNIHPLVVVLTGASLLGVVLLFAIALLNQASWAVYVGGALLAVFMALNLYMEAKRVQSERTAEMQSLVAMVEQEDEPDE